MVPQIARHLICPIHERLLRRETFRYLRELERSQWWSPDELREHQRSKVAKLLAHAHANVAFFRRRLDAAGVGPAPADAMAALRSLPLLSKSQIRKAGDDALWRDAPGGLFEHNTGGSTGHPLIFYLDRRRQGYDQAARIRTHRWFGVDQGDRELYLWGSPIELTRTDRVKRLRDVLFNHKLMSAFDMSCERMDEYIEQWRRYRPACLFGYPSSIARFIEHAATRGACLRIRELRAVFVTGEVCYPHQREAIERGLDVPVADGYGSREAGFVAHECPLGNMHLTAENVLVETVDADGRSLPCGKTGEIVVTHLDAYAMPFIRYRTGDRGRLKAGRCACGRGLPMMDVVQGRATDFLYLPDGTVKHALSIIYPLRAMPGVKQFRVVQDADFSVSIDVVADDHVGRITRESVAAGVRPVVGDAVGLRVAMVDRIASADSGKHRYVVSHAGPDTTTSAAREGRNA